MKSINNIIAFFALLFSHNSFAQDSGCDSVLVNGFNEFNLYSEIQINEAYSQMFSYSESELDSLADQYEKGDALKGAYKMIGGMWSSNRNSSSFREKFQQIQFRFKSGQVIDNQFYEFLKTKTVNNETINAWEACKLKEFDTKIGIAGIQPSKGGFFKEIIGDESGLFTFVINKKPEQGQPKRVKIVSVTKNNLEFIGTNSFKSGGFIEDYTGLSQSMRLLNPNEKATLVVTIENFNPISHEFSKNALSNFPLGSVITSVLDFNAFSKETKNNPDGYFDPTTSKWAPADGRDVTGSDYQRSYNDIAPDLRGQFLRGVNQFYSSGEPNEYVNGKDHGKRILNNKYSYQAQATSLPSEGKVFTTVSKSIVDRHITNLYGGNQKSRSHENNNKDRSVPTNGWTAYVESGEGGDGSNQYGVRIHGKTDTVNLSQQIQGGNEETRPQNIGVYYYIRINK